MSDFGNMIMAYGMPPEPASPRVPTFQPNPLDQVQVIGPPFPNNQTLSTAATTAAQALDHLRDRLSMLEGQLAQAQPVIAAWREEIALIRHVLEAASKHRGSDLQRVAPEEK